MGKYNWEMNMDPGSTIRMIADRVFPRASVLEFGCAEGRLTRYLSETKACSVSIVEIDKEAFQTARNYAGDGLCSDIDSGEWKRCFAGKSFDFIIFADVLEHLRTAEETLSDAKAFLKPGGEILISVPNIAHNDIVAALFNNHFCYTDVGLLDNTHLHFWGEKELEALCRRCGLSAVVVDASYQRPFLTEQGDNALGIPEVLKSLLESREYNEVYEFFLVLVDRDHARRNEMQTEMRVRKSGLPKCAAFYWDLGDGYQEGQFRSVSGEAFQGMLAFTVTEIPDGCEKVRFDPPITYACIVKNSRVVVNGTRECKLSALNGIPLGENVYLFVNVVPQMELALRKDTVRFTVYAEVLPCTEEEAERLRALSAARGEAVSRLDDERRETLRLREANTRQRDSFAAERQVWEAEREKHAAERVSWNASRERFDEERIRQLTENKKLYEENRDLYAENKQLSAEKQGVEAQRQTLSENLHRMEEKCVQLQDKADLARSDCLTLEESRRALEEQYRSLEENCRVLETNCRNLDASCRERAEENRGLRERCEALEADVGKRSEEIRSLEAEAEKRDGVIRSLEAEAEKRDGVIRSLEAEAEKRDGVIRSLEAEAEKRDDAIRTLEAEAGRRDEELQSLTAQRERALAESQDQAGRLAALQGQYDQRAAGERDALDRLTELRTEYDALSAEQLRTKELNVQLYIEIEKLQLQYVTIANSQCWRITAPIRKLLDYIKRTKLGAALHKTAHSLRIYGLGQTFRIILQRAKKNPARQDGHRSLPAVNGFVNLREMFLAFEESGYSVYGGKKLRGAKELPCVLLVSHELDLTGAPVAIEHMAHTLLEQGRFPVVVSPRDGALRKRFLQAGIPVIVCEDVYRNDLILRGAALFSMIAVNTIVGAPLIAQLSGRDIPVLWWIHEARASYHLGAVAELPKGLEANIHVYCVGARAQELLREYRPNYLSEQLLYCIPDYAVDAKRTGELPFRIEDGKIAFVSVGMLEERKGQDVFARAIRLLAPEQREKCVFIFIGREYYQPIIQEIQALEKDFPENVRYCAELSREDIMALYRRMDCMVCTSRDDPMPIVVTEAMAFSKLIVCSENTGSAKLLEEMQSGFIYRNNDPMELAGYLSRIIDGEGDWSGLRSSARETYDRYFSKAVFAEKLDHIYQKITCVGTIPMDGMISVVIPTYNAGELFPVLMQSLREQRDIPELEIVIVDSGSRDGTAETAEAYGARVIRIPQSSFSHSYARNLGAKNAAGKYLLFMTQDAIPGNPYWMHAMAQPILHQSAVAVSCREEPRGDCDLLGRFNIWNHSNYMGILTEDRILQLPETADWEELRKNGQLNDVSCMIRRDVFLNFGYRGDYAEDLDLGIRLIQFGYRLALLSSAPVIHSHTRPGFYYLRRSLVDVATLRNILPEMPIEEINEAEFRNRMIICYAAIKAYIAALTERLQEPENNEAFFKWTERFFAGLEKRMSGFSHADFRPLLTMDIPFDDEKLRAFVMEMYRQAESSYLYSPWMLKMQEHVLLKALPGYLRFTGESTTAQCKEQICDMMVKLCGQCAGNVLAYYSICHGDEASRLNESIRELRKGI